MNSAFKISLILAIVLLALNSCKKDVPELHSESISFVTGSLAGRVTDENGQSVINAEIIIGNQKTYSSSDGLFIFRNIELNALGAFVNVSKQGYFNGSRLAVPRAGTLTQVAIKLLPKTSGGTFASASGGVVTSASGVAIDFAANSVELDGGGAYNGPVNVAIQFIDPSADDLSQIMPGDLRGINADGEDNVLETYGMTAIELTGSDGQKLNLVAGKLATLKIPLSGNALSSAPANIPLWYFDEEKGMWIEEGNAQLVDNEYIGEVSHFSFWNVDVGDRGVRISGDVKCDGLLVEGLEVSIYTANGNKVGSSAITDPKGSYSGYVPINATLTIKISIQGQACVSELYNSTIGPFTSASAIPTINACVPLAQRKLLKATLKDCDGNPFQYGVLKVASPSGTAYYTSDVNGIIERQIVVCGPSKLIITAYDVLTGKESDPIQVSPNGSLDLGDVSICANTTFITGRIVCNDLSLENTQLVIKQAGAGKVYTMSYDPQTGEFSGHIDANTPVEITLLETICNVEFYSATLGPFGKGTQILADINACPDLTQSRITASTVDCNDNILPYASAEVAYGSEIRYVISDANGLIDTLLNFCNVSSLTFTAINSVNNSRGTPIVKTAASTIALGDIDFECPQGTDYIYYSVNGNLIYSGDSTGVDLSVLGDTAIEINGIRSGLDLWFLLNGPPTELGKHATVWRNKFNMFAMLIGPAPANDLGVNYPWFFGPNYGFFMFDDNTYEKLELIYTEFGNNPGDYVAGTFIIDMKYDDGDINYYEAKLTGGFRLKRK